MSAAALAAALGWRCNIRNQGRYHPMYHYLICIRFERWFPTACYQDMLDSWAPADIRKNLFVYCLVTANDSSLKCCTPSFSRNTTFSSGAASDRRNHPTKGQKLIKIGSISTRLCSFFFFLCPDAAEAFPLLCSEGRNGEKGKNVQQPSHSMLFLLTDTSSVLGCIQKPVLKLGLFLFYWTTDVPEQRCTLESLSPPAWGKGFFSVAKNPINKIWAPSGQAKKMYLEMGGMSGHSTW